MKTITVYAVAETPNEAMSWAERGEFTLHNPTNTMPEHQRWKVWEIRLEVNAVEAVTINRKN